MILKNLQKMIPDGWIGRLLLDAPFNSPLNRLDNRETFVEFKTLASLVMTSNARAQQVQSETEKRAHDLDLKYPGSTFTQVLKSHGKYGRYLVLVVGPFANLSDDFMVLCDFLGRARALKAHGHVVVEWANHFRADGTIHLHCGASKHRSS